MFRKSNVLQVKGSDQFLFNGKLLTSTRAEERKRIEILKPMDNVKCTIFRRMSWASLRLIIISLMAVLKCFLQIYRKI